MSFIIVAVKQWHGLDLTDCLGTVTGAVSELAYLVLLFSSCFIYLFFLFVCLF